MSMPLTLLQPRVVNETQDQVLDTVKLFPHATSNVQTRFVLPRQGTLLDSNSTLTWHVSWDGFDPAKVDGDQLVLLKNTCGGLASIRRARFFVGSKLIFDNEDVGSSVHIKKLSDSPDYRVEVDDLYSGGQSGYYVTTNGKFELIPDGAVSERGRGIYCRALGKYSEDGASDTSIQCSLKIKDIFSGLKSIQLPIAELDDCRIEIDWETGFDEVAYIFRDSATAITNTTIEIKNPTLLLDYLTVDEEMEMALKMTMAEGAPPLPFVHTSVSSKIIPEASADNTSETTDVLLALQGKLLMKMYVSHRLNNTNLVGAVLAPQRGCGRCRSQRNKGFEYNLFINDLAIHDQPVNSATQAYNFLELAHQRPPSLMAGTYDRNKFGAVAVTDVVSDSYTPAGQAPNIANNGLTAREIRDTVAGNQAYIGFDLSKFDDGSEVVPENAGYRVGSSSVILRITQTSGASADTQGSRPKTVQVFTEEVRVLQMKGGKVDVFEA